MSTTTTRLEDKRFRQICEDGLEIERLKSALDKAVAELVETKAKLRVLARSSGLPPSLHPVTRALVLKFTNALAQKLYDAQVKFGYGTNFTNKAWMDECRGLLRIAVEKGDPKDVAAYSMFLWHHNEPTNGRYWLKTGLLADWNIVPRRVTATMASAGVTELHRACTQLGGLRNLERAVREVFDAMITSAPEAPLIGPKS